MNDLPWPHPDSLLTLTNAAKILGVARRTLARNVDDVKLEVAPSSLNPAVAACARLYAGRPESSAARIPAREVMLAVGVDPAPFEALPPPPPPKPRRLRLGKKEMRSWHKLPPRALAEEMREAWLAMTERDTKNNRRRVIEIAEVVAKRGLRVEEKWITPEIVVVFATMSLWAARAPADALWPFLLVGPFRRPVDLLSAGAREMSGELVLLTTREYVAALAKALEFEASSAEREELGKIAEKGKAPVIRRLGQKREE